MDFLGLPFKNNRLQYHPLVELLLISVSIKLYYVISSCMINYVISIDIFIIYYIILVLIVQISY